MATVIATGAEKNNPPRRIAPAYVLRLAAAPTFAFMAAVAALQPEDASFCGPVSDARHLSGMTAMYLLMCVFHLPAWLRLADDRKRKSRRLKPERNGAR
ncbi:hypothetical protein [Hwanghaeella sp.]|uniref:hypothetical protein n=1 Tax=Hwanghaeella sp. TaxID=2605943 RepID=UPI003CCC289F